MASFSDDFNRPNEPLEDSPDWTILSGVAAGASIFNNKLKCDTTDSSGTGYASPDLGTADHKTQISFLTGGAGSRPFVTVRMSSATSYIGFRWRDTSGGQLEFYKRTGTASFTLLGSAGSQGNPPFTARLEANGNDFELYNGDTLIASATDTHNNTETRQGLNPRSILVDPWVDDYLAEDFAAGATVTADPLVATTSLDATPVISAQITADPLSVTGTLSAGVSTGVNVTAQPLAAATSLSADQHVSAAVTSDPLTAVTSLGATAQIGVNQAADPLTVTASLAGASIISVNQAADPLTATTSLSADIQAGAGVTINAQPLTATTSLSASTIIGVNQSASPLTLTASLLGNVIAGAVIINTDAAETLHLTVEDPALNLTAESPTLNLTP